MFWSGHKDLQIGYEMSSFLTSKDQCVIIIENSYLSTYMSRVGKNNIFNIYIWVKLCIYFGIAQVGLAGHTHGSAWTAGLHTK